jgi:predicted TIM-barrel enzyme
MYLKNKDDYLLRARVLRVQPNLRLQGINVIYLGNDEYSSLSIAKISEADLRKFLKDAYHADTAVELTDAEAAEHIRFTELLRIKISAKI